MNLLEVLINKLLTEKIKEYGKKEKFLKVIDIGGDDGRFTSIISDKLIVIDINPHEVNSRVKYIKNDIMKFDIDEKFDLIVCSAFMEHFTRKEGKIILKKINKFLNEQGIAFIACPNAWSVNRLLGQFMGMGNALSLSQEDINVGHKYLYNLPRLENIIKDELLFINSGSFCFKPLPSSDMIKLFDENCLNRFVSVTSEIYPNLKYYLAEIFVVCKKKRINEKYF